MRSDHGREAQSHGGSRQGGESPFAELLWQGTEESAGPIHYQLAFSTDSAAVANGGSGSTSLIDTRYLPMQRWAQDVPTFWSVRTIMSRVSP